jgi:hypothetical protein
MKTADAEQQFVEAARLHGAKGRGPAAVNREYDRIIAALRTLRSTPDRGREFLLSCLANPDPSVVSWAASYLLPKRPRIKAFKQVAADLATLVAQVASYLSPGSRAVRALTEVAMGEDLVALSAQITLEEWRAGRLETE